MSQVLKANMIRKGMAVATLAGALLVSCVGIATADSIYVRLAMPPSEDVARFVARRGKPVPISTAQLRAQTVDDLIINRCGYTSAGVADQLRVKNPAFDNARAAGNQDELSIAEILKLPIQAFAAKEEQIHFPACLVFRKHRVLLADGRGAYSMLETLDLLSGTPFPQSRVNLLTDVIEKVNGPAIGRRNSSGALVFTLNAIVEIPISDKASTFQVQADSSDAVRLGLHNLLKAQYQKAEGSTDEKGVPELARLGLEISKPVVRRDSETNTADVCNAADMDSKIVDQLRAALEDIPSRKNFNPQGKPASIAVFDSGLIGAREIPRFYDFLSKQGLLENCVSTERYGCTVLGAAIEQTGDVSPGRCGSNLLRTHGTIVSSLALGGASQGGDLPKLESALTRIVPYRLINKCLEEGTPGQATPHSLPSAIDWLLDYRVLRDPGNPVNIVNVSWLFEHTDYYKHARARLAESGLLLVAAAGNQGQPLDKCCDIDAAEIREGGSVFPAIAGGPKRHGIIVVGAADKTHRKRWSKSNYGKSVDIFAPGECIPAWNGTSIDSYSGTSVAAPIVSFTAALLVRIRPPDQEFLMPSTQRNTPIKRRLLASADLPQLEEARASNPTPNYNSYESLEKYLNISRALDVDVDQIKLRGESGWRRGTMTPVLPQAGGLCAKTNENRQRAPNGDRYTLRHVMGLFVEQGWSHILPADSSNLPFACEVNKEFQFEFAEPNGNSMKLSIADVERILPRWQ